LGIERGGRERRKSRKQTTDHLFCPPETSAALLSFGKLVSSLDDPEKRRKREKGALR